MKRPVLFTALVVTAALPFVLSGSARAYSTDSTTAAPNPSGYATCTGVNSDGSTATWTVGGSISFTDDVTNPPSHYTSGYFNIHPILNGPCCTYQIVTSSNIKSGCAPISGSTDLYYTSYPGNSGNHNVATYNIPRPVANTTYNQPSMITIIFPDLDDTKNAQYKVTSIESNQTLGKVATPYL